VTPVARVRAGVALLALLVVVSTFAYVAVEGVSVFDAFYMVMITISTVGFREVVPLSVAGRAVTVGIMVLGVGLAFYTAGAGVEYLLEAGTQRWRRRILRQIASLSDHVILCGYGRVGRGTFELLRRRGIDVVVVEVDSGAAERAQEDGALVVIGDATHDQALLEAGIERAETVIACVTSDSDNLVIVLSAKALRPDIRVISRASELEWDAKLRRAGADQVVAPPVVGSERLAALASRPSLTGIVDVSLAQGTVEFFIQEVRVAASSPVAGKTLRDSGIRERTGASILAMEAAGGMDLEPPGPESVLVPDRLVVVGGTRPQVDAAIRLLGD